MTGSVIIKFETGYFKSDKMLKINCLLANKYKAIVTAFSLLIIFIFPCLAASQIVSDFQVYSDGSIPNLDSGDDGKIHLTYSKSYSGVKYLILDSLLTAVSDTLLIPDTDGSTAPSIKFNSNFVALTWREIRVTFSDYIQGTIIESTLNPQIDTLIYFNDDFISDCSRWNPQVCFLNDTLLLVVWWGLSPVQPIYPSIYGQFFSVSNKFFGSNFSINEHDQLNITSRGSLLQSFASDSGFIVVWIDDYSGEDEIYGRLFYLNGIPKDSSFLITDDQDISNLFYLCLDMDSHGNFCIVWSAEVNSRWKIFWRWYDKNGVPLTTITALTDSINNVSSYSDVDCSISGNGKIVVAWEQDEDNHSRIYTQRFDSDRIPIGEPFRITSNKRPFNQLSARILLRNDNIYTFWGESNTGVWANIINFNNPPTLIEEFTQNRPDKFLLSKNYPNPFNNSTTFTFYLFKSDFIVFNIYDISGKKITSLLNNSYLPGSHKISWNGTNASGGEVASGVYFGELITSYGHQSIKMVLIR